MRFERVLVVDDRDIDCYVAQHMIRKNEFAEEVIIRNSVDDGMLLLRTASQEHLPDVIFLDIRMPEKDGFDFLNEFITLPDTVQEYCRIVMYSTSALHEDLARMRQYRIVKHFFVKPVNKERLQEVARALNESEGRRAESGKF